MLVRLLSFFSVFIISSSLVAETFYLQQQDFAQGTYIIDRPGTYVLSEDIAFNPNSAQMLNKDAYSASSVQPRQYQVQGGNYSKDAFGLGFFSAIAVVADDVTIDLNGHRLEQSKEHALLQRFFAVIELADQPFIPGQGPHNFGNTIRPASRIVIKNGTIGLSSHHGIHGNGNRFVHIEGVRFEDFEIAAVALNGVQNLTVKNCSAKNRDDIPVLGTFSAARFLQPYLQHLVENNSKTTLQIGEGRKREAKEIVDRLKQAVIAVHRDLIIEKKARIDSEQHPEEYALFHNPHGVIDGNCYGFLINSYGQAVEGFPVKEIVKAEDTAQEILFENVVVESLKGRINEVIALNHAGSAMTDPIGAVLQTMNTHPDTGEATTVEQVDDYRIVYKGNLLADAQILIAKAHHAGEFEGSGLDLSRMTISKEVIDWAETGRQPKKIDVDTFSPNRRNLLCNADSMFHVNKGVIGFKIDAAENVRFDHVVAKNITNFSEMGSGVCGMYEKSHPKATLEGCGGPKARAYSIAGSFDVQLNHCLASNIEAVCGTAVGFDVLTDSEDVQIQNSKAEWIFAGRKFAQNEGPNENPLAVGFRVGKNTENVSLVGVQTKWLYGHGRSEAILDNSKKARISSRQ